MTGGGRSANSRASASVEQVAQARILFAPRPSLTASPTHATSPRYSSWWTNSSRRCTARQPTPQADNKAEQGRKVACAVAQSDLAGVQGAGARAAADGL